MPVLPSLHLNEGNAAQPRSRQGASLCTLYSRKFTFRELRIKLRPAICGLAVAVAVLCLLQGCGSGSSSLPSKPVFSNASLQGNYNYKVGGVSYSAPGGESYVEAGTFVADGKGHITSGSDDFVHGSTVSSGPITGTYSISSDGTGMLTLNLVRGTVRLAVTLNSDSSLYLIEFDSFASGDGVALQQSADALSSIPNGTFAFHLHSSSANNAALGAVASVGQMTIQQGSITGTEDEVRFGVPGSHSLTGSMTAPDADGKGKAVLTDDAGVQSNYFYYVVDSNTLKFLETDPGSLGGGRADVQSGAPFGNGSLSNGFVFRGRGDTLSNSFGVNCVGAFVSDGKGNIVSGSYDAVQDGTPTSNAPLTGTYSVASNGRVTLTLNPQGTSPMQLIAWIVDSSSGFFLVNTLNLAEDGRFDQQQDTPFSAASLNASSAFYMFGSESQSSPWLVRVGVMSFDGTATVTFNNYFVNRSGSTAQNGPVTGAYTVSPNGRVTAFSVGAVNTQIIYMISNSSGSLMLGASGSELAGSIGTTNGAD